MYYLSVTEYVAAFPYDGQHKDDLSFKAGDTIKVSWAEDNGWWYGTLRDHVGWFPSNHLEVSDLLKYSVK